MTQPKGTIVVDELILPIVDIYLDGGRIWITAEVLAPVPAVDTGTYVVCDRSGAVVYRSQGEASRITWPEMTGCLTLRITAALAIGDKAATPDGPATTTYW